MANIGYAKGPFLHSYAAFAVFATGLLAFGAIERNTTELEGFRLFGKSDHSRKKLLAHQNVTVWTKGTRTIYILGARSYSPESSCLASELVQVLHPEAVFVDIDEHVFVTFGLYDQCKKALAEAGVPTDNMNFQFEEGVEGTLPKVPKEEGSSSSFFSFSSSDAVEKAIHGMFAKLKYAGLENQPKAESGAHFVNAIVEGHKYGATLVMGGRSHAVTKERSDQAMANTASSAATTSLDLEWRPTESDRENYRRYREEIKRVFPSFHQVIVPELDEHIAAKLNKLERYPSVVAVVMLLHVDGVEDNLKTMGWKRAELTS